jgi:hypothetical protein
MTGFVALPAPKPWWEVLGLPADASTEKILGALDPIDAERYTREAFAKIKHALRKAMGRSVEAVESAVAKTLDTITPQECANYLANAGYKST